VEIAFFRGLTQLFLREAEWITLSRDGLVEKMTVNEFCHTALGKLLMERLDRCAAGSARLIKRLRMRTEDAQAFALG